MATSTSTQQTSTSKDGNRNKTIVVAGATGDLGGQICNYLAGSGATVRALVRKGSKSKSADALNKPNIQTVEVAYNNPDELVQACRGAGCVVSALSGLRPVIVEAQMQLLNAAVEAGVPRFIPSDFSIDFAKLPYGTNRNLDLRREFMGTLDKAPIKATSVLNGMFADLLTGQAPVVLFGIKRVLYWGSADQLLDFTTIANTAEFAAAAALDDGTPRWLRVAGDVRNAHGLKDAAATVTGEKFGLLRPGGLGALKTIINITRTLAPAKDDVFPAWQGMQYMHNMFTGLPKLQPLDNDRYPHIKWTKVEEVLTKRA